MEHLEVTDFILSHFDENGKILDSVALYEATDINYGKEIEESDIIESVQNIFGPEWIYHTGEVLSGIGDNLYAS